MYVDLMITFLNDVYLIYGMKLINNTCKIC